MCFVLLFPVLMLVLFLFFMFMIRSSFIPSTCSSFTVSTQSIRRSSLICSVSIESRNILHPFIVLTTHINREADHNSGSSECPAVSAHRVCVSSPGFKASNTSTLSPARSDVQNHTVEKWLSRHYFLFAGLFHSPHSLTSGHTYHHKETHSAALPPVFSCMFF